MEAIRHIKLFLEEEILNITIYVLWAKLFWNKFLSYVSTKISPVHLTYSDANPLNLESNQNLLLMY